MLKTVVVGLGRFGSTVARELARGGAEVLAVDRSARLAEGVADEVAVAVGFDATDPANLQAYDVGSMDAAVVAIGNNFESSVLVTMHLKALGVETVHAKALNEMQAAVLRRVGADRIITPEEDMGRRLAEHLLHESVVDFVELPAGFSLRRLPAPGDWLGKSLAELKLLGEHRLNLIQIHRDRGKGEDRSTESIPLPDGATVLVEGDVVDVIGPDPVLDKLGNRGRKSP
jgi:trk system potassium uptake protein TrkA